MAASFHEQTKGLVEGGADLLCVETCQDALQASQRCMVSSNISSKLIVAFRSLFSDNRIDGTMLLGTGNICRSDKSEPYDIDVIGSIAQLGQKKCPEHVRTLVESSPKRFL